MGIIDFIELATYCANRYKESLDGSATEYRHTTFVALDDDNVLCSITPHILKDAKQCLLIHESITDWKQYYKVELIHEDGCVFGRELERNFSLEIDGIRRDDNPVLRLKKGSMTLFTCRKPWAENIHRLWRLYLRLKDVESKSEIELIAQLYKKDESILELGKQLVELKFTNLLLQQERDQYKDLLDKITEMVDK